MAATLVGRAGDSAHRIERGRTPGGFAAHRPAKITADQRCQIIALACEKPEQSERPISQGTSREIAAEVIARGIVSQISPRRATRLFKMADLKPHLIRYWLTPEPDPQFEAKVAAINALYQKAPALAAQGERVLSTDELTGVQALERKHPNLPPAPGKLERREFEYTRHGTLSFSILVRKLLKRGSLTSVEQLKALAPILLPLPAQVLVCHLLPRLPENAEGRRQSHRAIPICLAASLL